MSLCTLVDTSHIHTHTNIDSWLTCQAFAGQNVTTRESLHPLPKPKRSLLSSPFFDSSLLQATFWHTISWAKAALIQICSVCIRSKVSSQSLFEILRNLLLLTLYACFLLKCIYRQLLLIATLCANGRRKKTVSHQMQIKVYSSQLTQLFASFPIAKHLLWVCRVFNQMIATNWSAAPIQAVFVRDPQVL